MRSPFKLLDAYSAADKNVFFGRTTEVEELYTLIFRTNLLVVYGLSGTGKTSVIQCGLASKFDGPDWYPMFIRRGDDLNESLQHAMETALRNDVKSDLVENITYLIRRTLRPVYLIFDQFEELFILGSENEQETFIHNLKKLIESGVNAKVLLVMREEYIGQLYPFEQIIPQLFDYRFRVEPMGVSKVKSVIRDSFDAFNIHLQEPREETLQHMIDQITDPKSGIALPYLQVYLDMLYRETYRKQHGKERTSEELPRLDISTAEINALGRMSNVLDKFLTQQSHEINGVLRSEFKEFPENGIQLILDPFATEEGTKRPVHYTRNGENIEIDGAVRSMLPELPSGSLTRAIELLDHARILRLRDDTLELAHDSLAAIIDQKRTGEQRQLQELRRRLTNAHEEFQKTGLHLNAKQIAAFEEYLPKLQLSEELLSFIRKSEDFVKHERETERKREREVHEAKQHKKLARTRGTLLTLATLFAAGAVLLFFRAQNNYEQAQITGERLQAQMDTTQIQRDSIENILLQVDQLIKRMDSIDRGEIAYSTTLPTAAEMEVEIQKTRITLKSLVSNDTISRQNYATASVFGTAAAPTNNLRTASLSNEFDMGQDVYAYALVSTPNLNEWLQVKWFGPDQKIVGNVNYVKVSRNVEEQPTLIGGSAKFQNAGPHIVRLYNSAGLEIASSKFNVSAQQAPQVHIKPGNFKMCTGVSQAACVGERRQFSSGSNVYYHMKIHSPNDRDIVKIVFDYPDGTTWSNEHDIGRNMSDGYTVWSYKRFDQAGRYLARVLNSQGSQIAETRFAVN